MLQIEIPVFVIWRLPTKLGVSEGNSLRGARSGDGRSRRRRNEAYAVAGIDEGRRLEGRVATGPVERGLAGGDTAERSAGVETELAESLTSVDAPAHSARMRIRE